MLDSQFQGDLELRAGDRVELIVVDGSLARAFFEGTPAARLLGRARLGSDERDASASTSSWDALVTRLLGTNKELRDHVKRAVARHTRVAVDEGALHTSDGTIAALVFAVACGEDADASLAEIVGDEGRACDPAVALACAIYDGRLGAPNGNRRAPLFEACVRLAAKACVGPLPWERLREAAERLRGPEVALTLLAPSKGSLFPRPVDAAAATRSAETRMAELERAELDALVREDPRALASKIARADRQAGPASSRSHLDTLVADLARLLSHAGVLVLAIPPSEPPIEDDQANARISKPSWLPQDYSTPEAAEALADALERGSLTLPRLRSVMASGGEPALDAVGAEMLHVAAHPFASAAFAELLARSARPRDIIRLVTYFAVAPDPTPAARALGACTAPELPRVLSAWLEAMLPSNGEPAVLGDDDPERSSAARLTACIASLAPYPHLHRAVQPLLARVSDAPPPSSI